MTEESLADYIMRLEQENRELKAYKDVNEDFKKAWDELNKKYTEVLKLAKENADSNEYCLQELEKKYEQLRSALEEIRNIILRDNSMIIDKEVYFEFQCGEPVAFKLQKIFNLIKEVLNVKY